MYSFGRDFDEGLKMDDIFREYIERKNSADFMDRASEALSGNGIEIQKKVFDIIQATKAVDEKPKKGLDMDYESMDIKALRKEAAKIEKDMKKAAADLQFEKAAELRDKLLEIRMSGIL